MVPYQRYEKSSSRLLFFCLGNGFTTSSDMVLKKSASRLSFFTLIMECPKQTITDKKTPAG